MWREERSIGLFEAFAIVIDLLYNKKATEMLYGVFYSILTIPCSCEFLLFESINLSIYLTNYLYFSMSCRAAQTLLYRDPHMCQD